MSHADDQIADCDSLTRITDVLVQNSLIQRTSISCWPSTTLNSFSSRLFASRIMRHDGRLLYSLLWSGGPSEHDSNDSARQMTIP